MIQRSFPILEGRYDVAYDAPTDEAPWHGLRLLDVNGYLVWSTEAESRAIAFLTLRRALYQQRMSVFSFIKEPAALVDIVLDRLGIEPTDVDGSDKDDTEEEPYYRSPYYLAMRDTLFALGIHPDSDPCIDAYAEEEELEARLRAIHRRTPLTQED